MLGNAPIAQYSKLLLLLLLNSEDAKRYTAINFIYFFFYDLVTEMIKHISSTFFKFENKMRLIEEEKRVTKEIF